MPERDPEAIRAAAKDRLPRIVREEFGEAFLQIEQKREGRREFFALGDSNNTPLTIRVDAGPLPDNELVRVYGNTSSDNHVILLSDQLDIRDVDTVLLASLEELEDKREYAGLVEAESRAAAAGHSRGLGLRATSDIGRRRLLPERFHYAMPGTHPDGRRISRAELPTAVERAGAERDRVSRGTLEELRREAASLPAGEYPKRPVMVGGGAALAARDPDRLLVDGRGRWHVDPIQRIVQTADHMDHLRTTGMGDPYQFANRTERVPRPALQLWENEIAAQGPVIDGMTRLYFDDRNRLLAEIRPSADSDPVTIEVEGKPLIATGFQPELVPGVARGVPTVPDATDKISDHLSARSHPQTAEVTQALARLSAGEGSAQSALDTLESADVLSELRASDDKNVSDALTTLDATAHWDRTRELDPDRVLLGDEVGEGRFEAHATDHWLVVGMGGTGASVVEAILQENPNARVTILGGEPAFVLQNAVQLKELTERHGPDGDGRLTKIDGRLSSLDAATGPDGRLRVHVEAVDTKRDADNNIVHQERKTVEAGAVVACLGRVPKAPPVLNEVLGQAVSKDAVEGRLMFDDNGQYLGYNLSVDVGGDQREFEVTGAVSRLLPADVFSREDSARVVDVGVTTVPEEAANVPAGFMGTALQSVALEEHRAKGNDDGPTSDPSAGPTDPDPNDQLRAGPPEARHPAEPATGETPQRNPRGAGKAANRRLHGVEKYPAPDTPRREPRKTKNSPEVPKRKHLGIKGTLVPREKPQTPPDRPVEETEGHQNADPENTARTSSAIWETVKPSFESWARRRSHWGQYDDQHGYDRSPPVGSVMMPKMAPGPYEKLLHPDTVEAYARDLEQSGKGHQGPTK
ncbi:hypothetical protein [Nocardiopsis eucommiae]|uniref:hypothetical protein n=1 Tax=Nocardiopsis eucommiae TaxID=2831970 RepID=UPI003D762555